MLVDVLTEDATWGAWSASMLARWSNEAMLVLSPIVFAELAVAYERADEMDAVLPATIYRRESLPCEAAFLAGRCHALYRKRGGKSLRPLPDLLVGAHAAVRGYRLLTRDARRYRTYFPRLDLIAPPGE